MKTQTNIIPVSKLRQICDLIDNYRQSNGVGHLVFDIDKMEVVFNPETQMGLKKSQILFTWNGNIKEWQLNMWVEQPMRTN